jgi:hypothetical protein
MILVVAARGRPDLVLVTSVHVEDAPLAAAAQRHEASAVDDDVGPVSLKIFAVSSSTMVIGSGRSRT